MPAASGLISLAAVSFAVVASANFLEGRSRAQGPAVTAQAVEEMLISELEGQRNAAQLQGIKRDLAPMFEALPKGSDGRLESVTVRYALHRYFSTKHGWHVSGLEPHSINRTSAMEGLAPGHLFKFFNQRLNGKGMTLHELAIFAATLKDLIHSEVSDQLLGTFQRMGVRTQGAISEEDVSCTTELWLLQYLLGMDLDVNGRDKLDELRPDIIEIYPTWEATHMWAEDLRRSILHDSASRRNPFVEHHSTYAESDAVVQELAHHFGQFQDLECRHVKSQLMEIEEYGTGRVPLSRFYVRGLGGTFTESVEYLRSLGTLDETNPGRPSVMIANYVNSKAHCFEASTFYSVCCVDECEALLKHVETEIAAPKVSPARLAAVISAMPSDTVDAPRNLSTALSGRLDEVAAVHDGMVYLHSRLFAQWMHYAYPRECPFPHVSGTVTQVTAAEWMETWGEAALDVTEAEMKQHVDSHVDIAAEEAETMAMLWSSKEELLAGQMHWSPNAKPRSGMASNLLAGAALVALLSFTLPLLNAIARLRKDKSEKYSVCWGKMDKHVV